MKKFKDVCLLGIDGESLKGNYSEINSNENELEGISKDYKIFKNISMKEINEI